MFLSLIFILCCNLLHRMILCSSLNWNVWIFVSLTILKGSLNIIFHTLLSALFIISKTAESPTTRFHYYNITTEGCQHDVFTKYRCQIDTMTIFLVQRVYFNCTFHHHEVSFIKWSEYEFIKDYLHNGISISISWLVMRFNIRQLLTIQNICTD